ncbi:MAG: hypothetical protein OEV30_13595, partial [Ignavibacteria bacterium]|nr:hypothetical protein [Ignavibacteria bacterium]
IGSEEVQLTVVNQTSHFIHVIMNGDSYLYVGPRGSAVFEASAETQTSILAVAFYAPAQGIQGRASEHFVLGGEVLTTDCHYGRGSSCATQPTFPSVSWAVTPELLAQDTLGVSPEEILP